MPNYKCIKRFKSTHGKVYTPDEILGAKYMGSLTKEEKANFEYYNDLPDIAPSVGLGNLDKHRKAENLFRPQTKPEADILEEKELIEKQEKIEKEDDEPETKKEAFSGLGGQTKPNYTKVDTGFGFFDKKD